MAGALPSIVGHRSVIDRVDCVTLKSDLLSELFVFTLAFFNAVAAFSKAIFLKASFSLNDATPEFLHDELAEISKGDISEKTICLLCKTELQEANAPNENRIV